MVDLDRLWDRAFDGLIGIMAGGVISLIGLVPTDIIADSDKWIAGAIIFTLFVLSIIIKYSMEIYNKYEENAEKVDKYLGILPRTVRFERYERNLQIKPNGDGIVEDEYRLSNMGDNSIPTLSIRQFCDIYRDIGVLFDANDSSLELDQPDPFVNLIDLKIDEEPINPNSAYERDGYLIGEDCFQEKGQQKISFDTIGGLTPENEEGQSTVAVDLKYKAEGALDRALQRNDEGDYIACDCYHPTDSIELVVNPPNGHNIELHETDQNPTSIEVIDIHGGIQDSHEKADVSRPTQVRDDRLVWEIENPKVNYRYKVYFRCPEATPT